MPTGYHVHRLLVNGKAVNYYAHRLVAMTYIPNPDNKRVVNHIDGNKINNKVDNLEWCSYLENHQHAERFGLSYYKSARPNEYAAPNRPESVHAKKLNWEKVTQIRNLHGKYSYRELAKKYDVAYSVIANIVKNRTWRV